MLERFRLAQRPAVERLLALHRRGALPPPFSAPRPAFSARLRTMGPGAVIAEYKRASPSRGALNLTALPEDIAASYAENGAAAISVLTEQTHFKGDIAFLSRMHGPGLPLLRKDFLIHPLQIAETAATPASALLLIVRMLEDTVLAAMLEATYQAGLEAVLEIFDSPDLARARKALAVAGLPQGIIQVNNRDLQTLTVSDAPSRTLIRDRAANEIWISASGIAQQRQVLERANLGFDAVLVGGSVMQGADPGASLRKLTGITPMPKKGQDSSLMPVVASSGSRTPEIRAPQIPGLKICGLTRPEDVLLCLELGVQFTGFIFAPQSPRRISPEAAAALPTGSASRVGVFAGQSAQEVRDVMRLARLEYAQLHGGEDEDFCRAVGPEQVIKVIWPERLREGFGASPTAAPGRLPGRPDMPERANGRDNPTPEQISLWRERLQARCARFAPVCAMFLFDAGLSGGGGGQPLPLKLFDGFRSPRPWLLAGGVGPDNLTLVLNQCTPFAVDCNSRVEQSPGVKSADKLRAVVELLRKNGAKS